ncbi:unnamed protein product, partial [Hydatigera taeniaeformis]|uniref:ApeC domain-containing protein n=1 Tax=Hydatigena taeniaeformis TaxID=6205 RepID=A0A0R3XAL5_HYDTA
PLSAIPEPETTPEVEANNGTAWPAGSYSLLTTIREDGRLACPPGFNLAIRYNIRPDVIANTFFRPMSFAEYFTQKPTPTDEVFGLTNETSMPTLHTCERNASDVPEAYNLTAFPDWPPGNYCVLMDLHTRTCPQGLHRFTRQLAELCCHTASSVPASPVKLPFVGDFFLMGAFDEPELACLPIENTHVMDPHIHSLCHYLPLEWLKTRRSWPPGDYLLPIGKRGQPIQALSANYSDLSAPVSKFACPAGFHRILHEYSTHEEEFDTDGSGESVSGSTVMLHFCQHNQFINESASGMAASWPKGDYCVIVNGAICPPEMHNGKSKRSVPHHRHPSSVSGVSILNSHILDASNELVMRIPRSHLRAIHNATDYGDIIEGQSVVMPSDARSVTYYSVCCREDKQLLVDLPAFSGGMYLPAGSSLCSSIPGTFIEHEQITTYLDPTLLDPYVVEGGDDEEGSQRQQRQRQRQRWMPPPFEEPGVMTLCYYHQMQKVLTSNSSSEDGDMLHELLEPGSTALSLWLAGECGCAENAICRPFKRFSCKCKRGYFGDGVRVCRQVTPLTGPCANLCHEHAECKTRRKHSFISRTVSVTFDPARVHCLENEKLFQPSVVAHFV